MPKFEVTVKRTVVITEKHQIDAADDSEAWEKAEEEFGEVDTYIDENETESAEVTEVEEIDE
ncbi:MAG: hypothetical protein ACK4S4_15605 [Pyrinomonadaceae bacterium]